MRGTSFGSILYNNTLPQAALSEFRFTAQTSRLSMRVWGFTRRGIKSCVENAGFAVESVDSLDSSLKTTNLDAGSTPWKRWAFRGIGAISDMLGLSDRMAVFARKERAEVMREQTPNSDQTREVNLG